jgi:SNF family Na+-dependent transporter
MAFIMAAVGSAVGLGNLWRFPVQAFKNGGGAFFIPYFIALISAGIPLVMVEYALGQKYQGGAPQALAAVTKKFKWVGWLALLVGSVIVVYYVVIMSYAWRYCVASFNVAWTKPAPVFERRETDTGELVIERYPADSVQLCMVAPNEKAYQRLRKLQDPKPADERLPVFTIAQLQKVRKAESQKPYSERILYVSLAENVKNYFNETVLGGFHPELWSYRGKIRALQEESNRAELPPEQARELRRRASAMQASIEEDASGMFDLNIPLVLGALITWIIIYLIIFKGVKNVGRVVMLTVPLPIVLLLLILVRGVTLPGAAQGLFYYLKPNWSMLTNPEVWINAYGQVFFSLSLGFGILIAYASYMPEESDVANSALITSFGNCATSFFAGLAVFSVLGYLAYVNGQAVENVVSGGPGLVFITYPIALAKMPMGTWAISIVSLLFFICLVTLGIDSAFSLVEGIVTGFRDHIKEVSKPLLSGLFCAIGFAASLFICTRSGLMWLDILDNWMANYGLALVGLLECIAVGYFFHIEELREYINKHSEVKIHRWFDAFVKFVTPTILIVLLARQLLGDIAQPYGGYDQIMRHATHIGGWGVFFGLIVLSFILGRSWHIIGWTSVGLVVTCGLWTYFNVMLPDATTSELIAPAVMGAVAVSLLCGGLVTSVYIARKTHHMAGLSMEDTSGKKDE